MKATRKPTWSADSPWYGVPKLYVSILAFKEIRGVQEKVLVAQHGPLNPTETKGDSVAGSNDDDCEPAKFFRSPEFLEVARGEWEGDEGDDELFVSHVMREGDGSNAPGSCKSHARAFDSVLDVSELVDCRASWLMSGSQATQVCLAQLIDLHERLRCVAHSCR